MALFLGAASFGVAFVIGRLIGRGRRRQLALALAGVVAGAVVVGYVLTDCEGFDCWVGAFFFAALVVIWLAGVGSAVLVRHDGATPGWRTLAAASAVFFVVGTGFVFDRYGNEVLRLGCGSRAKPDRALTFEEVIAAFENGGLPLDPIPTPPEISRRLRAQAFRHVAPGATLYVVHCPARCGTRLRPNRPDRFGHRFRTSGLVGRNTVMWITDRGDVRAATRLRESFPDAVTSDPVDYRDRCYDP